MISKRTIYSYCFYNDIKNIENFEKAINDTTQTYICHHRLETHTSDGVRREVDLTKDELIALDMYYSRPAEELIFLTKSEHNSLHNRDINRFHIDRKKLSEVFKRKYEIKENHPMYGKHHSEESKRKMSENRKGKSAWNKGKSTERKGMKLLMVDGKRTYYKPKVDNEK